MLVVIASGILRWNLMSNYSYSMEYRAVRVYENVDCLSRLPLPCDGDETISSGNIFNVGGNR